jgi:hypothetical protein
MLTELLLLLLPSATSPLDAVHEAAMLLSRLSVGNFAAQELSGCS